MKELDLFKWVNEWEPEWRWDTNSASKQDDVIIWISIHALESFFNLLPYSLFDEGSIEARICDRSIAIWASDICYPFDIDVERVFPKQSK